MSNVVQFLEALSLDPSQLTEEDYAEAVATANFDPKTKEALIKRDPIAISRLLGGRGTVMAFIMPAEEEQDDRKDGDPQPDDGDSEGPEHVQEQSSLAA